MIRDPDGLMVRAMVLAGGVEFMGGPLDGEVMTLGREVEEYEVQVSGPVDVGGCGGVVGEFVPIHSRWLYRRLRDEDARMFCMGVVR